jgi:excisionase family DNA binding protein
MFQDRLAVSVREAAAACGYSPELIRRAITEGKLIADRPGGRGDYRIRVEDLDKWIRGVGFERVERKGPRGAAKSA